MSQTNNNSNAPKQWAVMNNGRVQQRLTMWTAPDPANYPGSTVYATDASGNPVDSSGNPIAVNGPTTSELWADVRMKRDQMLRACDWTQLADAAGATQSAWRQYRQSLRDLPQTQTDPSNITWPTPPAN
jgi:hypothetical protein